MTTNPYSDDAEETSTGDGRQLEFDRASFSASERRLEPLPNDYDGTVDGDEGDAYDSYNDHDNELDGDDYVDYDAEPADYELAPEGLDAQESVNDDIDWGEESDEGWYEEPVAAPAAAAHAEYTAEPAPGWPLGLILTAVAALALLAVGGYGVMQQRASMQEEIRELQARLATSADSVQLAQLRRDQEEIEAQVRNLNQSLATLQRENRILANTNAALEEQLAALQIRPGSEPAQIASTDTPPPPVEPVATAKPLAKAPTAIPVGAESAPAQTKTEPQPTQPTPSEPVAEAPAPATPQPSATPAAVVVVAPQDPPEAELRGPWFVNFAAYSQEEQARSKADDLDPSIGRVVVIPVSRNDRTLYRVRVIGLANSSAANALARELEAAHGVSKLWVGQD